MGKISLDLTTDASSLLEASDLSIEKIKELAAQGRLTKDSLKADFEAAGRSKKEFNAVIQSTVASLAGEGKAIEALILKYGNARQASIAVNRELATMQAIGKRNTEEFKQLSKIAGELAHSVNEVTQESKKLASETKVFDKVVEAARGMTAAFEVAAGASALFGDKNEDLEKTIRQTQGAMSLALGVQELARLATEKGGIATGIATAAQALYATVVGTSTGALKLFRLALLGTGIGAAIVGIGLLVEHWDDLKNAIFGATKEQKLLNDLFKGAAEEVEKERISVGGLVEEYKNENTTKERRIAILKQLKEESPAYFGQLNTEKTSVDQLTTAYGKYAEALIIKAQADAVAKKIAENNLKQNEVSNRSIQESLGFIDQFLIGLRGIGGAAPSSFDAASKAAKNNAEETGKLKAENEKLTESLSGLIAKMNELGGDPNKSFDKVGKAIKRVKEEIIDITGLQVNFNEIVSDIIRNQPGTEATKRQLILNVGLLLKATPEEIQQALAKLTTEVGADIQKVPTQPVEVKIQARPVLTDQQSENLEKFVFISKGVQDIVNNVSRTFTSIADLEIEKNNQVIESLNKKIKAQENSLSKEEELRKRGLANNVSSERRKLAELHKLQEDAVAKQRKLAEQRQAIDAVTQTVSLITASAQIFQSLASAGPIGVAIAGVTIASMFAAFLSAQIKAAELASTGEGFRSGGYTGDGDPSEVSTALGKRPYKYHKKEFVMDEELTANYRDFFEALHNDDKAGIIYGIADLLKNTGVVFPDEGLPRMLYDAKISHDRIVSDENNEELKKVNAKLESIEMELKEWKEKPVESMVVQGDNVIVKRGNRTKITYKKK